MMRWDAADCGSVGCGLARGPRRGRLPDLRCVAALVLMAVVLASGPARAGDREREANALYREAKTLITQGELRPAEAKLTLAWAVFQHPLIMKKRAEVREQLRDLQGAVGDYGIYLGTLKSRERKEKKRILERVQQLQALLKKPVKVTVVVDKPGALVSLDKKPARRTPFEAILVPGEHHAELSDPRFRSASRDVVIPAGAPFIIQLVAVSKTGAVLIRTDQDDWVGVRISIDNEPVKIEASRRAGREVSVAEVSVGRHELVCASPGRPSFFAAFDVTEDVQNELLCAFDTVGQASDPVSDPWGWAVAGAGVASLAAGVGLIVSWQSDVSFAAETNQDLVTSKDVWGFTALGIGVALGVASAFVFMRDGAGVSQGDARARPVLVGIPVPGGGLGAAVIRF